MRRTSLKHATLATINTIAGLTRWSDEFTINTAVSSRKVRKAVRCNKNMGYKLMRGLGLLAALMLLTPAATSQAQSSSGFDEWCLIDKAKGEIKTWYDYIDTTAKTAGAGDSYTFDNPSHFNKKEATVLKYYYSFVSDAAKMYTSWRTHFNHHLQCPAPTDPVVTITDGAGTRTISRIPGQKTLETLKPSNYRCSTTYRDDDGITYGKGEDISYSTHKMINVAEDYKFIMAVVGGMKVSGLVDDCRIVLPTVKFDGVISGTISPSISFYRPT